MTLKYLGHASFLIKSKDAKIITDPYDAYVGIKFPKTDADIVTVSHHHKDHDASQLISGSPLVVDWPGEFEKKGVRIIGYKSYHDKEKGKERGENILYKIEADGVTILHCGDLGLIPDDALLEEIGEVDILLVPVGGHYTIDSSEALELIKHIEPSIVIPMHYNDPKLNQEVFGKLTDLSEFTKKYKSEAGEPLDQLTVKKEDLAAEEAKLVVMKISS